MRSSCLAAPLAALLTAIAACRSNPVNPCDRDFPDVERTLDVPTAGGPMVARLRVSQRFLPGIDGGCAAAVPVQLTFIGATSTAMTFQYRVTWNGVGGGWHRDGTVARLAPGASLDIGRVDDAARVDDGAITVTITDARAVAITSAP